MVRPGSAAGDLKESRSVGRELQVEGGWCGQREELQRIQSKENGLIDKSNSLKVPGSNRSLSDYVKRGRSLRK